MKHLPPKSPNEAVAILFSFGDYLSDDETLDTPSLDVRAANGLDATPSSRFSAPVVIGRDVYTLLTAGTLGEDYECVCRVHTSNGQTLESVMLQPVRDIRDT